VQQCVNFRPVLQGRGCLLPIRAAEEMRATRFGSTFFCRTKPISRKSFIFMVSSAVFGVSNGPVGGLRKKPRRGGLSLGREILLSMILRAVRQNAVWRVRRTLPTRCDDSTAVTAIRWIDWRWAFVFSGARRYRDASPWLRRDGLRPSLISAVRASRHANHLDLTAGGRTSRHRPVAAGPSAPASDRPYSTIALRSEAIWLSVQRG